ncbi:MAG TPA: hypothetical protein VFV38_25845 [Ktedonobacteraceae bacterium]|nr:hypothetical protein [Ktedonobacteraceae bacterium]
MATRLTPFALIPAIHAQEGSRAPKESQLRALMRKGIAVIPDERKLLTAAFSTKDEGAQQQGHARRNGR